VLVVYDAIGAGCNDTEAAARPGDVAQLVEHLLCKQGVRGSSPLISTTNGQGCRASGMNTGRVATRFGGIAQLVEHYAGSVRVRSSSLLASTCAIVTSAKCAG
jgi:hypothetical protein